MQLGIDTVNNYNFAFVGESGVGKSSLINSIRGLRGKDQGAAETGVTETTQITTGYPVPGFSHVVLWDLPGCGTISHSSSKYFMEKKVYAFDFVFIVTGNRVKENDVALITSCMEAKVPVAIMRSKSDVDLDNETYERDCSLSEIKDSYRTKISSDIRKYLPTELRNVEIFVVSARVILDKKHSAYQLDEERLQWWVAKTAAKRVAKHHWDRFVSLFPSNPFAASSDN